MTRRRRDRLVFLAVILAAGLLGFAVMAYFFSGRNAGVETAGGQAQQQADATVQPAATPTPALATPTPQAAVAATQSAAATPTPRPTGDGTFMSEVFGLDQPPTATGQPVGSATGENWRRTIPSILWRLALAAMLAAGLAFRPRKNMPRIQRNLYVAQTQILLAVVASSLMMIVGDNAARAFGIFAAVSLVRFRTNIRDPKEITVLLISLAIGLATGVGRWDLAVILTIFTLPLLWFLEYNETEQVFRSMELTVKTRHADHTQEVLRRIFRRYGFTAEMRQLDPPDEEEPVGCIMYHVSMSLNISTDQINEEILALDPDIEGIEWDQRKNTAYVYQ